MQSVSDVSIKNLVKTFGGIPAVNGVSLEVPRGSFLTLLGASGCGKTTMLRMIGGFEQPDSGEVLIHGTPMGNTPPHLRETSMVFQGYALFPHMSVRDNIAYGLGELKVSKHEANQRVQKMLDLVELPHMGDRKPSQLSGGQQQRVALARSLVIEPTVLLLDEPLGALDLRLRKQMQIELKRIQQRLAITFIYVTHDQEEALTMSDRIVVMRSGRVEQEGSPQEIFDQPATRYAAEFMGAQNVLAVRVESRDANAATVIVAGQRLEISPSIPVDVTDLALVIRPERVRLDAPEGWHGRVSERLYKGSVTSYRCALSDGTEIVAEVPRNNQQDEYLPGDAVRIGFESDDAVLVPDAPAKGDPMR